MGYEAQIAGLTDSGPFAAWQNPIKRALKRGSRRDVERSRKHVVQLLREAGFAPAIINGGGTGSVEWSAGEPALTEVTVGSGFLVGHLFDYYAGLTLAPALHFALQVVRRPAPGLVTCHLGGYVASGAAGPDRLPLPVFPEGARLLPMEGAGEVQTPVQLPDGVDLSLGAPVLFRPAKSGELAERFKEYLLVRGDQIVERAQTYRGFGRSFG
jgi:D-serine deaminase-like pyridoxal phosphate-dependent protein